ncbi:MAG: dienelactone hydrolase [Candidatus Devosia phytovorans]|uniref:Dienelactone hydrolase n=1 Tax=Candidatus Devosia phytovorans TaxID=3121372 RepID=A0AAJ6B093_9HYPH|nr:dienelactone hydrolase family protein [Devosia sp.]WEK05465.1 MAG: dienelactone hydrolase [Devosia sp.]
MRFLAVAMVWAISAGATLAQDNRIDSLRPDAPVLAQRGDLAVGVRTLNLVDAGRPDILAGGDATQDRPLTVELWYPAKADPSARTTYEDVVLRDGVTLVSLTGTATRDAAPDAQSGPYPLVVVSHGFPGNRFLLSHFGENLASKGYVVAAVDHFESTYDNQLGFASTLANRAPDQLFVLDTMSRLDGELAGLVDAENSAIIGYSMGGYGALVSAGAGLAPAAAGSGFAPAQALAGVTAGSPAYADLADPRLKAIIAIGPWGRQNDFWDADGLAGITMPVLFMAGDQDEVSDYRNGIRVLFEETTNADRHLLTFAGAGHNAAAPIPAPHETYGLADSGTFEHYADFVWSNERMNNVAQHFATAFLDLHLKGQSDSASYFAITHDAIWPGFGERATRGLTLEHLPAAD